MASVTTPRIVPGAPPPAPAPISKVNKKKYKSASKLHSSSDSLSTVASSPSAQSHTELPPNGLSGHGTPTSSTPQLDSLSLNNTQKSSPFIEAVSKRLKATQKKISRIKSYASDENLNEDQRRTAQNLPSLEFVARELEELKKAVEVVDSEVAREEIIRREAAEEVEKFHIMQAVSDTKAHALDSVSHLFSFLRLHSVVASSHPVLQLLNLTDAEISAIYSSAEVLLGEEGPTKEEIVAGIFSEIGEYQGIPYSRLMEVTRIYRNPPADPQPETDTVEEYAAVDEEEADVDVDVTVDVMVAPPTGVSSGGGLLFMQESELESEAKAVENDQPPVEEPVVDQGPEEITTVVEEVTVDANVAEDVIPVSTSGPIDWAADEHSELPEISGLHARFGSDQTTTAPADEPEPVASNDTNGFSQARDGRGRGGGRGFRGDRGRGGGYRGHGERGGSRGFRGERGSYRGRGEGSRGRGDGDWRGRGEGFSRRGGDGEYRGRGDGTHRRGGGDGEHRGRGRGRGRGEERGGSPP